MKKVVTFGELLLSLCAKDHERLVQTGEFVARYTGAEANVSVSLAHFGMEAYAVSKVPAHEIGQACVNFLRRYGVHTDYLVRGGERLGLLYLETGASQRASKVVYDRAHSSIREVRREEFDWDTILASKDWLHFSGTAPALGENVIAVLTDGLRTAKRLGLRVSCDCNYRSKLWGVEEAGRVLRSLMEYVDVLVGGREDAEKLFGIRVDGSAQEGRVAELLRDRLRCDVVAMNLRTGTSASLNRLAGLMCDATGCYVSREYEMQIVDRVGGGDAFAAGLIYGLLSDFEPQRVIEFAAAASCLKHSIPGDFNLVSVEEVEQLLAGVGSARVQR
jgi:2-dehydro-3-deoxygluconokinase